MPQQLRSQSCLMTAIVPRASIYMRVSGSDSE
jgi:hypothetical protein